MATANKKDANDSSVTCNSFNKGVCSRANCHGKHACENYGSKEHGAKEAWVRLLPSSRPLSLEAFQRRYTYTCDRNYSRLARVFRSSSKHSLSGYLGVGQNLKLHDSVYDNQEV